MKKLFLLLLIRILKKSSRAKENLPNTPSARPVFVGEGNNSIADIVEKIKGEKSVIENWIKQKAAGSPAPHFIGVGQALQKSKGVLSGRLANSINKNSKQFKFTKKTGKKTMENIM